MNLPSTEPSDQLQMIPVADICEDIIHSRCTWLRNGCEVKKNLRLAIEQDFHCALCNREFVYASQAYARSLQFYTKEFRLATLDHIRPLARGGNNEFDNYQLACRKCNGIKSYYSGDYGSLLSKKLQSLLAELAFLAEYAELHPASVRDKIRAQLRAFEYLEPELTQLKINNLIDRELIGYCVSFMKKDNK